jgi:hypothetical protein
LERAGIAAPAAAVGFLKCERLLNPQSVCTEKPSLLPGDCFAWPDFKFQHMPVQLDAIEAIMSRAGRFSTARPKGLPTLPLISGKWDWQSGERIHMTASSDEVHPQPESMRMSL